MAGPVGSRSEGGGRIPHPGADAYVRSIRILAEAESLDAAATRIVESIASLFGWQAGALWLVDGAERFLRRAGGWSAPEIDARAFDEAGERLMLERGRGLPGRVWASGEPAWIEDVGQDPNFPRAEAAAAVGLRAAAAFPVTSSATIGVLEFLAPTHRAPDEELLQAMSALGQQIAQGIERWRTESLLRSSEEVKAAVIGAALDCVITMDGEGCVVDFNPAAEQTFGYAREEAIGAELASLIIPEELRERHRAGVRRVLKGGPSPILNRRIELVGLRATGERFPVELTVVQARAGEAPLFAGFVRDVSERKEAEDTQRTLLAAEREARLRAEAAERRARELAATLQQSLLPPELPAIPNLKVAARFRAGGEGVDVGGDFYDLVPVASGGWGLLLGDVCGKGPAAATVAGLARYTARAVALHSGKPATVLGELNEALLAHGEGALTSAAYLAIADRELCLALAGHPKPLLVRNDGSVEEMGAHGTILGFLDALRLREQSFRLEDDQVLVLYTDGVTETRTPDGLLGIERLKAILSEGAGADPEQLVDHVMSRTVDHPRHSSHDDAAVLALRVDG